MEFISNFTAISKAYCRMAKEKDACRACSQFNDYKRIVHSQGNAKNPMFMFVGECPGEQEVLRGVPFVGSAGQLLRAELRKNGFHRGNSILTNVMPCRPKDNQFPDDFKVATACYRRWLREEIRILGPKFIIALGGRALRAMTGEKGITQFRGRWRFVIPLQAWIFPTWHPSYVLRQEEAIVEFRSDIRRVASEWHLRYADRRLHMGDGFGTGSPFDQELQDD